MQDGILRYAVLVYLITKCIVTHGSLYFLLIDRFHDAFSLLLAPLLLLWPVTYLDSVLRTSTVPFQEYPLGWPLYPRPAHGCARRHRLVRVPASTKYVLVAYLTTSEPAGFCALATSESAGALLCRTNAQVQGLLGTDWRARKRVGI